jgi:hypothetical protein
MRYVRDNLWSMTRRASRRPERCLLRKGFVQTAQLGILGSERPLQAHSGFAGLSCNKQSVHAYCMRYSHSIVLGGLLVMSKTTRFT